MHVRECQNETHFSVQCPYANKILKSHSSKENPSVSYFPNAGSWVSLSPTLVSSLWGMVAGSVGLFGALDQGMSIKQYSTGCWTRSQAVHTACDFQAKPHGRRGSLWMRSWGSSPHFMCALCFLTEDVVWSASPLLFTCLPCHEGHSPAAICHPAVLSSHPNKADSW